jgi:hypothetical protein
VFVPTRRTCRPITQNLVTTTAAANAASSGAGALGGGSGGRDKDAQHWQGRPDKWDSRPSGFDRDGRSPDGWNRRSTSGVTHTKDAADAPMPRTLTVGLGRKLNGDPNEAEDFRESTQNFYVLLSLEVCIKQPVRWCYCEVCRNIQLIRSSC